MKSRRSFLSLLGLGAVAAPAAVVMAKETASAAPALGKPVITFNSPPRFVRGRDILARQQAGASEWAQSVTDCSHTHSFTAGYTEGDRYLGSDCVWHEWRNGQWVKV